MERCPVRIGLAVASVLLLTIGPGCKSLGLGKGQDARPDHPSFYDEFFGGDAELEAATSSDPGEEAPSRMFKRNRLPGGLSPEAREIERGSFNIY